MMFRSLEDHAMWNHPSSSILIALACFLLERLLVRWAVASAVRRGSCRDRQDPRFQGVALLIRLQSMALTILLILVWLIVTGQTERDADAAAAGEQLARLEGVVETALLYVALQLPGMGLMLARSLRIADRGVAQAPSGPP